VPEESPAPVGMEANNEEPLDRAFYFQTSEFLRNRAELVGPKHRSEILKFF
jgi:hypothetical protein